MWARWLHKAKYQRIEEPKYGFNEDCSTPAQRRIFDSTSRILLALYLIMAFLIGLFSATLANTHWSHTYETGYLTEIKSLYPAIKMKHIKFSGTLKYKENGHLYIDLGPGDIKYFGEPSSDVDDAWVTLIGDHEGAFSGGVLGPDVLHSLHCLNEVRKILDSRHYYNRTLENLNRGRRIHIDHCLNHIRQIIQCHMDLTPVRTLYFEDMNTEVGDFDQVHMCRDFGKLREYMDENFAAAEKIPKTGPDGRVHRLGYPDNEESLQSWDSYESEFE